MIGEYILAGKNVTLYLKNNLEITGYIKFVGGIKFFKEQKRPIEDSIIIVENGKTIITNISEISTVKILDKIHLESGIDANNSDRYNTVVAKKNARGAGTKPSENFSSISGYQQQYGSIIPSDMLVGEDDRPEVSFSSYFGGTQNEYRGYHNDSIEEARDNTEEGEE